MRGTLMMRSLSKWVLLAHGLCACSSDPLVKSNIITPPNPDKDAGISTDADAGGDAADAEDEPNFMNPDGSMYLCDPTATWSTPTPVGGVANAALGWAITPDELVATWVVLEN